NLNSAQLSELGTDGSWKSFNVGTIYNGNFMYNLMVDSYNQKWMNIRGLGLLVYNENNPENAQTRLITGAIGNGALPSTTIFSLAQDKDGAVWIGTDQGVVVIYNPGNIFSGNNYDAQQILLNQDGHWQYLLQTEYVLSMAVDGANRKWFGT